MIARILLASAMLVSIVAGAQAADPAPTMLIFDGSGSMWGKLPGSNSSKLGLARDGVRAGLDKLAPDSRVGLASFGHRRGGDCSDIEIIMPPDRFDIGRIMAPLEKLNPRGRGPLVQAMRDAAQALKTAAGPASIVLVHDDDDNCQQDPCATAADLKKTYPLLTIHTVGLGLKRDDAEHMACVARATGGRQFNVQDAAAVAPAIAEALKLASQAGPPPAAVPAPVAARREPRPAAAAGKTVPAEPTGPPGLYLAAALAKDGEPLEATMHWRITRDGETAPVEEQDARAPMFALAPGRYAVEVTAGLVTARQSIDLAADARQRVVIPLNAAALRLAAPWQKSGEGSATAVFRLYEAPSGQSQPADKLLWIGRSGSDPLVLPPGTYHVQVRDGLARQNRNVVAAAGTVAEAEIPLAAGKLALSAVDREGGAEVANVVYVVTEDDPDAAPGRREVTRSAAARPQFVLPAGTYYLQARIGANEVRDRVLVAPGEETTRTMVLSLGRLSLTASLFGGDRTSEAVTFRALTLENPPSEVARASGPTARLELPAGRYRIETRIGRQNAMVQREVEVRPGGDQRLAIEVMASPVRFRLVGAVASDAVWEIFDGQDRIVLRSTEPEPAAVLAAGRYRVRVQTRERQTDRVVEIRAGESRPIEIKVE